MKIKYKIQEEGFFEIDEDEEFDEGMADFNNDLEAYAQYQAQLYANYHTSEYIEVEVIK